MLKLAESSGTVVYENENKLYIGKKPAQWTSTFLFVTWLLALIFLANSLLRQFVSDKSHMSPTLDIVFLGLGILFAFISWRVSAYRKKINTVPVNEMKWTCIIDLTANKLLDGQQHVLAPLERVQLVRKMQFTSSSPELILKWDKHVLSLVEGNPFSGGIAAVEKALGSKGITRK